MVINLVYSKRGLQKWEEDFKVFLAMNTSRTDFSDTFYDKLVLLVLNLTIVMNAGSWHKTIMVLHINVNMQVRP